jgi:lipopolysaccharide export LptBFGC system permease protein LptF
MTVLYLLLLFLAAVCFVLSTFNVSRGTVPKVNFIALGLLCWVLVPFLQTLDTL